MKIKEEKHDTKMRDFIGVFRRREYVFIIGKIRKLVNEIPPPIKLGRREQEESLLQIPDIFLLVY
ncbi:MAG: hypothetical protein RXO36_05785 [Candidatus Nanopusillus acidilobi]